MNAVDRISSRLDHVRIGAEPRLRGVWSDIGTGLLQVIGLAQLAVALTFLKAALDFRERSVPTSLVGLAIAGGIALAISGILTLFRRRRQLVQRLLGSLTTGTFAISLVFLSRNDTETAGDTLLTLALICAGFLLITIVFAEMIHEESSSG